MPATSSTIIPHDPQDFNLPAFQNYVQQFLLSASYRGLSTHTLTYYSLHLLGLERFFISHHEPFLSSTCSLLLQDWLHQLTKQGYARRSIRGRYYTCRRFFHFVFPDDCGTSISVSMPPILLNSLSEPACFTEAEVERILHQPNLRRFTGFRDFTMMLLLLDTGIRLTELSSLLICDLDWRDGVIHITRGKSNKSRFVPLQNTCAVQLRSYVQLRGKTAHDALWITEKNQPLQHDSLKPIIVKHCRGAGLRGSAHTFRRTMAKVHIRNGGDPFSLQLILGYSTLDMVQTYVRLFNNEVREQQRNYSPVEHTQIRRKR